MPFGQNTSPQKFYVFDSTSEFGFVFQIVSPVGACRQYTDYFTKLGPLLIAVPGRTGSLPKYPVSPTGCHHCDLRESVSVTSISTGRSCRDDSDKRSGYGYRERIERPRPIQSRGSTATRSCNARFTIALAVYFLNCLWPYAVHRSVLAVLRP